jgi:hypothetical protein
MPLQECEERILAAQRKVANKLTEAQWHAMQQVVEYLAHDELHNWAERGRPNDHIWVSVRELQDLLKAAGRIPNIANFYADPDGEGLLSDGHGDD